MVRPRFNFFITQADGTIFGSAVDPENNERIGYCFSSSGTVSARREGAWFELPDDEARFVRFLAGRAYHYAKNYLTKQSIY